MSIRSRVTVIVAAITIAVMLVVGTVVVQATERTLRDQVDAQVLETASRIKPSPKPDYGRYPSNERDQPPDDASDGPDYRAVAWFVYDSEGTLLEGEPCGYVDDPTSPPKMPDFEQSSVQPLLGDLRTVPAEDGSVEYRMLLQQDELDHYVVTAAPLGDAQAAVERVTRTMTLAGIAAVGLAALVSWWLISREFRPVDRMIDTAAAIGAGDLSRRVPEAGSGSELERLGRSLNRMLGRIEASSEAQARSESRLRQFVADAAHELRSPLTSVRGYAELYRQGAFTDPEQVTRAMDRIEGEGIRMKRLLDEMLLLARLDQKVEQVREPVDLSAVAREATDAFAVIQPGRPLSVEIEDGVVVEGDAVHVRQVIDNLLTNIRVHTPPDARAEVSLRLHDGAAELRVRDEGPGIDPAFLPHLFERFTREDPARTRSTGGSGLGMAIVAALVESMDGSIRAESEPGLGTTFVVRLPTSQPVNT